MDRKTVTAAVFLAGAGMFYQGRTSAPSTARTSLQPAGTAPAPKEETTTVKAKSELGPWTPVCRYIRVTAEEPRAASEKGTLKEQFCLSDGWHVTALIATIPNPELTHLSLAFDRYVESITWAVADGDLGNESYTFDSYWFPWRPDQKEETDTEKRKTAEMEREKRSNTPGVLLFRRNTPTSDRALHPNPEKELLMVFLVGETPTSGVNRVAFERAWTDAASLADWPLPICGPKSEPKSCVGVLGPSFTGSLSSLRLLLDRKHEGVDPHRTFVISGAVTGTESDLRTLRGGVPFCTTIETDQNSWTVFRRFLNAQSWGPIGETDGDVLNHFALLGEDETEYGNGKRIPGTEHILTLRFPRGIARIRNSSEELPGLVNPTGTAFPELPLLLRDTGQDSISSFSERQGPVSQEAVLRELAATLRRERIRYVGIVATDSLDALFVTRAIHSLAPNIRIVLFSSDLLFARASQSWGLSGVLAVTSYPLISRNQYYEGAVRPRRAQFASDASEGEYNACRRMLLKAANPSDSQPCGATNQTSSGRDYLLDYTDPFPVRGHTTHKPPVWLTMLGHSEWWPVAATPVDSTTVSPLLVGPEPGAHATEQFSVEPNPQAWFLFFCLVWVACTLHVGLVFWMNSNHPWFTSLWKYSFLRRLGWGYKAELLMWRRITLAAASLTVASACCSLIVVVWSSGLKGWLYVGTGYLQMAFAVVTGAAAIAQAFWAVSGVKKSRRLWCQLAVMAIVAVEIAGTCYAAFAESAGHVREFAGYRAVHIESGASPVLPVIILLLAIYMFCWFRLSRLRMAEDRQTKPPKHDDAAFADCAIPDKAVQEVGPAQKAFVGAALAGWWVFFNPFVALATVEGVFYDAVLFCLTSIVIFMLALVLVRFLVTWRVLRKMLQDLERHPLRYAFTRLPKTFTWTTVWAGDPRPQLIMPSRSLDSLRMLPLAEDQVKVIEEEFHKLKDPNRSFREVPLRVKDLNEALNTAFAVITDRRRDVWREGLSDTIESAEKSDDALKEWKKDPLPIAAEEFLALRFVTFINYILRILRGFLQYLTYGFILLVIALAVYPFEGRRYIEIAILFIAIVTGASVALVFAQMDRDPLLSRLSETKPNELGINFILRLVSFGALPLLTVLASQVPDIGNFLLSWLQPALQSLK